MTSKKVFNKKTLGMTVAMAIGLMSAGAAADSQTAYAKAPSVVSSNAAEIINFSFPLAQQAKLSFNSQHVKTQSDEYWFTVNAKQLNAGVDIHTTVAGALIKISRQSKQGQALKSDAFELRSAAKPGVNFAGNVIKEDDLKATGVFENASAIKMDNSVTPGTFKLSYTAPLGEDAQFVVHVKEKHSASKLQLSTAKQHYTKGENLNFDALMMNNAQTLTLQSVKAFILSPSGKQVSVPVKQLKNGVTQVITADFAKDNGAIEAPINGLYELHLTAVANNDGQQVHRSGKIAFAYAPKTASIKQRLQTPVKANKPQANFSLAVIEPGRYEVRGILYGHDTHGQLKPIMETHSAKNLTVGDHSITMKFDQKLLQQTTLAAPYVVRQVRLLDQTRMSRLSM